MALIYLKKYKNDINPVLATQSIEARAREEGRASLYNWIVYKRGSKARERKEKKSSAA